MEGSDCESIGSGLTFPVSGKQLPNRIIKPAMTEGFADPKDNLPSEELINLYSVWAKGGAGGLITGNVPVDRRYLEGPRNVVMEKNDLLAPDRINKFKRWASAMKSGGGLSIVQLTHPGRQCPMAVAYQPIAPSGGVAPKIAGIPGWLAPVGRPREATLTEINEIVQRFKDAALVAKTAGFDGVEIHAAHGYLLSQFLSPKVNQRRDEYGGNAENRRRLLIQIVAAVREAVGTDFIVAVKLNSEDFAQGGFSKSESLSVIRVLDSMKAIDFIEISGGTYEDMRAMKSIDLEPKRESTKRREAFFIDFCNSVRLAQPSTVIMLSGGWRSGIGIHNAIVDKQVDIVGIARPLCLEPDFPRRLVEFSSSQKGKLLPYEPALMASAPNAIEYVLHVGTPFSSLNKTLDNVLEVFWHQYQMKRLAAGLSGDVKLGGWWYMLSFDFLRTYVYDPRKNPRKTQFLLIALSVATAVAALRFTNLNPRIFKF